MITRYVLYAVILPILAGCAKNSGPATSAARASALGQSAKNWCRIDEINSETQIISRWKTDGNRIVDLTFMRNEGSDKLVSYPYSDFLKNSNGASSFVRLADDAVKTNDAYDRQARLFRDFAKTNPALKALPADFSPSEAVEIKEYGVFSDSTSVAYPCSSYSGALEADTESRPLAELSIYLGQTVASGLSTDSITAFSPLQLPIEPVDFSAHSNAVAGWCSWAGSDSTQLSVKVMVVGKDKVIEAFTSSYPHDDPKDEAAFLKADLSLSKTYKISGPSKNLSFEVEFGDAGNSVILAQTYQLARDSRGELALLPVNAISGKPPLIADATNLFFECSDSKQNSRYTRLPPNLNKLIDGLRQKL